MNMKNVINVKLYGGKGIFGGKETPLEADVIKCDKYKVCSLYKKGECRNIRLSPGYCKHGVVERERGYTKRAKKYGEFKNKWQSHEKYNKLKLTRSPFDLIDGVISIRTSLFRSRIHNDDAGRFGKCVDGHCFISIWESDDNEKLYKEGLTIDKDKLTVEILKVIYNLKPKTLFDGNIIKSYKEEFLRDLKLFLMDVIPETFKQFEKENGVFEMNFIGKKALLKTINIGEIRLGKSVVGFWDGEKIVVEGDKPIFLISKPVESIKTTIVPKKDFEIEITRNEQVNENTIFKN